MLEHVHTLLNGILESPMDPWPSPSPQHTSDTEDNVFDEMKVKDLYLGTPWTRPLSVGRKGSMRPEQVPNLSMTSRMRRTPGALEKIYQKDPLDHEYTNQSC